MKNKLFILIFSLSTCIANGQQKIIDSIKQQMPTTNDTLMLVWSKLLGWAYYEVDQDSVPVYNKIYLTLSKKLNLALQEADALMETGSAMASTNPSDAIDFLYSAYKIIEHPANENLLPVRYREMLKIPSSIVTAHQFQQYLLGYNNYSYGMMYWLNNRNKKGLEYFNNSLKISQLIQAPDLIAASYLALGVLTENEDSSLYYLKKSRQVFQEIDRQDGVAHAENFMAQNYASKNDFRSEFFYRQSSLQKNISLGRVAQIGWSYLGMADYYSRSVIIKDSALQYAYKAMKIAEQTHTPGINYWAALDLSNLYKKDGKIDSAYKYLELMLKAQEQISSDERSRQFESSDYAQQTREAAIQNASEQIRNKVKIYSLIAGILILTLLAIIFWRNNKRRQREFKLLQKQKAKTDEALQNLKSTQSQLIQSEKMASLGELTAGIAHEIQNPLNFVNNFSEVNRELVDELEEEADRGNFDEVKTIAKDIKDNEEKISHHGKRADAIVKGMLQHSRVSTGKKEPTDINKLADEYLRLSYHGLRAKDKQFNLTLKTEFDESIGKMNVVPQDIGRVLLNLFNNAFYAVMQKKNEAGDSYEPAVCVTTKKVDGKIEIHIQDNGVGISQKVVDKIFQPFFTTKPTGQGTGLGLSLTYDSIKAHGGEIKVDTKEGEGAHFIVELPIQ